MRKLTKMLTMAIVVLAVITMSLNVNAATAKENLINYIRSAHVVNGILFEITNAQKNAITDYINTSIDDNVAQQVYNDLTSIETTIRDTGATNVSQISQPVREKILAQAKATAAKAGLTLNVDTKSNTFTLIKSDGNVLASGGYLGLATNPGSAPAGSGSGSNGSGSTTTGSKLLYTGANYLVYALPVLAIVAVALIVKKRKA